MRRTLTCLAFLLMTASAGAGPIRLKDLVEFDGVRGNDLVGYGLVVGLNGTGDGLRNAPFTEEIMSSLLERLGVNVAGEDFRPKNVAAVFVTAALPPFARAGGRIDVTVSAIGDAKSLLGGTLIMTPLNGADGQIYAVAQGTIIAGGISAEGEAGRVVQECRRRAAFPRAPGWNAKWSLISPGSKPSVWRCAHRISPPRAGSKARSTPNSGVPWRKCWIPVLSRSMSGPPTCARRLTR